MNSKKKLIKNLFSIEKKNCIITGGLGGIGFKIAKLMAHNKANVIIIDRKKQNIKYKNIHCYQSDLLNKNKTKNLIDKIHTKFGKIDILINALGISDENSFINNINTNLISVYNLTKIVIDKMKTKGGSIVNFTSLNSELGFSNNPGYVSSKGALKMLTKSFAIDYAKYNIRVNNIGPGYIKTKMTKKRFQNKKSRNLRLSRIPFGRYGNPDELFGAIVFLISDGSKYITGQDFYVDGGFLAKGI